MSIYLIEWPNGTISFLTAKNEDELCLRLGAEGDPEGARVLELPKDFHLTTTLVDAKGNPHEGSGRDVKIECATSSAGDFPDLKPVVGSWLQTSREQKAAEILDFAQRVNGHRD